MKLSDPRYLDAIKKINSGNGELIRQGRDELMQIKTELDTEATSQQQESNTQQQDINNQQTTQTENVDGSQLTQQEKKFTTIIDGKEVVIDDPDGFLNRRDLSGMKTKMVNQDRFIDKITNENLDLRQQINMVNQKLAKFGNEQTTQQNQTLDNINQQQPQTQQQTQNQEKSGYQNNIDSEYNLDFLDTDPTLWTEDQANQFKDYTKRTNERQLALEKQVQEQSLYINEKKQLEKQTVEEENIKKFYAEGDNYAKTHLKPLSKPLHEVHNEINNWSDKIALAAGLKKPPENDLGFSDYINKRNELAAKYYSGDPETVQSLSAITPPDDLDTYYKVSDAYNKRAELIARKELGENATLEHYWAHSNYSNGNFSKVADLSKAEGLAQGRESVINVMTNNDEQNARTIDQVPASDGQNKMQRVLQVMKATPEQRAGNPALQAEYEQYYQKYKPKNLF